MYSLGIRLEKSWVFLFFFTVGMAGAVHFSVGHHFPHDIIFLPLGHTNLQLVPFCSMKFSCTRCVCNTVANNFSLNGVPLEIFNFLLSLIRLP